jgi:hypothetical protein
MHPLSLAGLQETGQSSKIICFTVRIYLKKRPASQIVTEKIISAALQTQNDPARSVVEGVACIVAADVLKVNTRAPFTRICVFS